MNSPVSKRKNGAGLPVLERKTPKANLYFRLRLKQNFMAYAFLGIPLLILIVFTFYPLVQGIYISFLDYKITQNPVVGGPIAFTKVFFQNLRFAQYPIISGILLIASLGGAVFLFRKKVPGKFISAFFIIALIINYIPLSNVINQTFREINYVYEDDRIVDNEMIPAVEEYLKTAYKGAQIVKEPVGDEETRLYVKKTIWVGPAAYRTIIPNPEYIEFVKNSVWYIFLLVSPFIGFFFMRVLKEQRNNDRTLNTLLKIATYSTLIILLVVTWNKVFHSQTWPIYRALKNSLKYLLVVPPLQLASILLAILVNQKVKGVTFFRTLYYTPVITGVVIIGYCWKFVYQPNGLLDATLQFFRLPTFSWLGDPSIALFSIMFVTLWRGLGWYMVLYLAGLQDISHDLIESAKIDGASIYHLIVRVYLPLLRRTILVCSVLSTIAALRVFEEIYVMSSGSAGSTPMNGTETMVWMIYDKAFGQFGLQFSYSAALAVILSIFIILFTVINFRIEGGYSQ